MRQEIQDEFGTYAVKTTNRLPIEEAKSIYLNLFDNGEKQDACQYKLVLSLVMSDGKYNDYICPILNHFEPLRWLRSVPSGVRDEPFYRQIQQLMKDAKKSGAQFDKEPSAGFFRQKRTKLKQKNEKIISIPNAIGCMFIEKGDLPLVAIRFVDFAWAGALEENMSDNGPAFTACLKSTEYAPEFSDDFSEYF
jgi:hypothetical protein